MFRINPDERITASEVIFYKCKILAHPWIREKSMFKKTSSKIKNESSIEMKKNKTSAISGLSLHKSKEKEGLNNTRKLTETCR